MSEITQEQIETLWHTLGLNPSEPWKKSERNYYAAPVGCPEMQALVDMGLMKRGAERWELVYHHATAKGKEVAFKALPKLSKRKQAAKQRYHRFLSFNDATGGNFREFLKYVKAEKEGAL